MDEITDIKSIIVTVSSYIIALEERIAELEKIEDECLKIIDDSGIKGSLITRRFGGNYSYCIQHYYNGKAHRKAISKSDAVVSALAKAEYCRSALKLLRAQHTQLAGIIAKLPTQNECDIADSFNPGKAIVCPDICRPRTAIIAEFTGRQSRTDFHSEGLKYQTIRGENVRSKSEVIIADALFNHDLPYVYEYPFTFPNGKTSLVDFAVMHPITMQVFYWEHFGMLDNEQYVNDAVRKLNIYEKYGLYPGENLIITRETSSIPFSSAKVEQVIQRFFG